MIKAEKRRFENLEIFRLKRPCYNVLGGIIALFKILPEPKRKIHTTSIWGIYAPLF